MSKKHATILVKGAISLGLIWFLLKDMETATAQQRIVSADYGYLLLAIAITTVQVFISVFRWRTVLNAIDAFLPVTTALKIYLIALFFNQLLPSSVGGDAVRMYKSVRAGLTVSAAVHSVMLERLATVITLIVLVGLVAPFMNQTLESELSWLTPLALTTLAGSLVVLFILINMAKLPDRWQGSRVVRALKNLSNSARLSFLSPRPALLLMFWGLLGHVAISVTVYCIARGLGLEVGILACLVLMPPVILVTTLPISIAGWGVRETAMVLAFGLVGVSAGDAFVLSFMFGILALVFAIPGAIVWFLSQDKSIEDLQAKAPDLSGTDKTT